METNPDKKANELQYYRELHRLVTELSTSFIELNLSQLDERINDALREIGKFADTDRSYLFTFSQDKRKINNTHEWCAECVEPQIGKLKNIPVNSDSWWMTKLNGLTDIYVPYVPSLPDEAADFKKRLLAQSIQSLIIIPIALEGDLIGFIGFDSVRMKREWTDGEIRLLRILGEILAHVLQRKIMLDELSDTQKKLAMAENMSSIGQLASGIAHQLRNPLSVLNNAVYYLKMKLDTDDEKISGYLSIMSDEIKRASNIINGLLHFVRLSKPQKENKTLRTIIKAALEEVRINDSIKVTTSYDDNIPPLHLDIGLMKEAICNMLDNAVHAMPHGGTLSIETKRNDGYAVISICDSGCGIAAEDMEKIFEPLYTTKERAGGTGIGLPLCKSIAEAHDGFIEVESKPDQGSSFTIHLPITAANG